MDDDELVAERGAFERTGRADDDEIGIGFIPELKSRRMGMDLTVEEYFMFRLKEDLKQLDRKLYDRLVMSHIRKSIETIPHLMYKNPLTYALGFYCTSSGIIDTDRMAECELLCIKEKKAIKRSDILRYARLILSNQ